MSETPRRDEREEQAIRSYAYQLWEMAGRPNNQEQEFWLDAEAKLEALRQISVRPIALPFVVVFTAWEPKSTWPPIDISCPIVGSDTSFNLVKVTSSRIEQLSTQLDLDPRSLAHDHRSVLLQTAAISTALDRIARLIEYIADKDSLDQVPFIVRNSINNLLHLDAAYLQALLQPYVNFDKINEIDRVLSDRPYAGSVTFDIEQISLGSNTTIVGRVRTTALSAVAASGIMLGQLPTVPPSPVAGFVANAAAGATGQLVAEGIKEGYKYFFDARPASEPERDAIRDDVRRKYSAKMSIVGPDGVMAVQEASKAIGIYPGPVDGILNEQLANAMREFTAGQGILNDWPHGPAAISALAQAAAKRAVP